MDSPFPAFPCIDCIIGLPSPTVSEHHSLAETAKMAAKEGICLLSALRFHNLTHTQAPCEIWMASDRKTRLPVNKELPIRYARQILFGGLPKSAW